MKYKLIKELYDRFYTARAFSSPARNSEVPHDFD